MCACVSVCLSTVRGLLSFCDSRVSSLPIRSFRLPLVWLGIFTRGDRVVYECMLSALTTLACRPQLAFCSLQGYDSDAMLSRWYLRVSKTCLKPPQTCTTDRLKTRPQLTLSYSLPSIQFTNLLLYDYYRCQGHWFRHQLRCKPLRFI
jgi:hypothetical protein